MSKYDIILEASEHFYKLATQSRGNCVFPAEHPKVNDNKDHFPINSMAQARNALARANQFSAAPEWYSGSLSGLVNTIARAVKKKYPSIEMTEKSTNPGKG